MTRLTRLTSRKDESMKPNELNEIIEELEDVIERVEWEEKTEAAMDSERAKPTHMTWYRIKVMFDLMLALSGAALPALIEILERIDYITDLLEDNRPLTEESKTEQVQTKENSPIDAPTLEPDGGSFQQSVSELKESEEI